MACRFPGANSPDAFWTLLRDGIEARTELSDDALREAGVPEALIENPRYVKSGMFLQGMEQFDPGFFGFSPLDGKILDPQHRHFLECSWEALEDGGYDPARFPGAIGVFAGSGHNAYFASNLLSNPELVADVGFFLLRHTGNDKDFLTTRASYCFDLKGPSVNVQTACSTSLVAVHQAAQSLLNGECDMALAGGVTVELPHRQGYLYKDSEILSRDGHCRPFDADASGTVFGSGVGVVLLKRLADARADGDVIHAVIKASAVNNDGAGKISYLAPSVDGQAAAIEEALAIGDIDPASVTYVECHGTGTPLGDPIEVAALNQAYGGAGRPADSCGIGSVKSNIGHLDTAAGVASLIKVVQSLKHRQLPATLHYSAPNPALELAGSPFYVNAALRDWDSPGPRRAGVSSLGVGGTNAHLVVEEAPPLPRGEVAPGPHLFVLSARTDTALAGAAARLADWIEARPDGAVMADAAYTLATGRRSFRRRGAVVAADAAQAVRMLRGDEPGYSRLEAPEAPREVAFMFAGGGAQYPSMGQGLYVSEPVYRASVDECLGLLRGVLDFDLKALLYPGGDHLAAARELQRPSRSLPALFVTQYAQARLWQSWGVEPTAMIGHSMGENTAACLAGVFSLKDALGLVALRGRLFEQLPAGGMLSVQLGAEALQAQLPAGLSLAAANAAALSVVSGPVELLEAYERTLSAGDIGCQRIHIDVAAHSSMLEPILGEFGRYLRGIALHPPGLPFISNLTGDWITAQQATDPDYWVHHLRHTVRFADGVGRLLSEARHVLLEVGPGRTLTSLASAHEARGAGQVITNSLRHPDDEQPDRPYMLAALGRLWQGGVEPDWLRFYAGQQRRRISLPTYAFDHQALWIAPGRTSAAASGQRLPMEQWYQQPLWSQSPLPAALPVTGPRCVIAPATSLARFAAALGVGSRLFQVAWGETFAASDEDCFTVAPEAGAMAALGTALRTAGGESLHGYLIADPADASLETRLQALFQLVRSAAGGELPLASLTLVSIQAQTLPGDTCAGNPAVAALLAGLRVVAAELQIPVAAIDLDAGCTPVDLALLAAERPAFPLVPVAYRRGRRWVQGLQALALPAPPEPVEFTGQVMLITGGLGGLGLRLARHLADRGAKVALLGRQQLPEGDAADFHLASGGPTAERLHALQALRDSGVEYMVLQADVADRTALAAAIDQVEHRWGPIDGVFHTAGVLADALLPLKTAQALREVVAPKARGLANLQALLRDRPLRCFVVYSSTSVFAGLPGQFDYAVANAYLDACAQAPGDQPLLAVNWPVWRRIGMAAALAPDAADAALPVPAQRVLLQPNRYHYLLDAQDWLLDQHRTRAGVALVPGTGFVDLAYRAALRCLPGAGSLRLKDLILLQPLLMGQAQRRVLSVVFEADGQFSITSSRNADQALRGEWLAQHAQGQAFCETCPPAPTLAVDALRARLPAPMAPAEGRIEHPHMAFGPRWACVVSVASDSNEALLELVLADTVAAELDTFPLHPALLDMATGAAQALLPGAGGQAAFFVPQGYGEIRIHAPLAAQLISHIVRTRVDDDSCSLDIRIADRGGKVLVEVDGFVLRRIAGSGFDVQGASAVHPDQSLQDLFAQGIEPDEGMAVIDTLLANPGLSQVLVLPRGPGQLQREAPAAAPDPAAEATPGAARPALSSPYVAPASDLETGLASLWEKALGVESLGVQDDFFELGGHSLLLIQVVNRARQQLGLNLPLAQLFGKPTIAEWVQLVDQGAAVAPDDAAPKPALKRVRREAYRADSGK